MFFNAYLQEAQRICQSFDNQQPLHLYLKDYFKNKSRFGSRDRRFIGHLVYAYFRSFFLGKNDTLNPMERIAWGSYIANSMPEEFFEKCFSGLAKNAEPILSNRLSRYYHSFNSSLEFPFEFSTGIESKQYVHSIFEPKYVFIRVRHNVDAALVKLRNAEIEFKEFPGNIVRVPLNTKLEKLLAEESYVVQDLASQSVGTWFKPQAGESWYDCCAASGGKSIMLLDMESKIHLTVSDIRESILHNLSARMKTYHSRIHYTKRVLDLSADNFQISSRYDRVICDAPCSGSGTWGRSPEQFYFFNEEKLKTYQALQANILGNALKCLKADGILFYITCSVFKAENEDVIAPFLKDYEINYEPINKFSDGGDCLFVAQMKRKKSE